MSQSNASRPLDTAASAVGHLYEAKERLKDAASAAASVVKQAATGAVQEGRERIAEPLADARAAAGTAANEAGRAARDEFDVLVNQGKNLLGRAGELIRQHPGKSFGAAVAVGWLLAKTGRR